MCGSGMDILAAVFDVFDFCRRSRRQLGAVVRHADMLSASGDTRIVFLKKRKKKENFFSLKFECAAPVLELHVPLQTASGAECL